MQLRAAAQAAAQAVYIIHVVIDDLGYNDFGFRNNQSHTPVMDQLRADGVEIPDFYVFKSCAPSRASVLSGRYPWHVGYSKGNGNQNEAVPLDFDLIPAYLKKAQPGRWETHALGKWHIGWAYQNCTPPARGFDSFLGTSGNIQDHWDHLIENAETYFCKTREKVIGLVEGHALVGGDVELKPATWAQGTYGSRVLTDRTRKIVSEHPLEKNLYVYLAFQNVHTPIQAPLETVGKFGHVCSDIRRVYEAMLTEVDSGVGLIVESLRARGMLAQSLFVIHSDNGGAMFASSNWPLRGEKFTYWEGGLRAVAVVSNPGGNLIPAHRRGATLEGMGHLSDWYYTFAHGVGGAAGEGSLHSGPIAPDSVNLWPWITGAVERSPRKLVVHTPLSQLAIERCMEPRGSGHGCAASLRSDDWKLIVGDPGDDTLMRLPRPLEAERAFGSTHENCHSLEETGQAMCRGAWNRKYGSHQKNSCSLEEGGPCLYNLAEDPSEYRNLAGEYPDLVKKLQKQLEDAAATEVPQDYATSVVDDGDSKRLHALMCRGMQASGHDMPADFLEAQVRLQATGIRYAGSDSVSTAPKDQRVSGGGIIGGLLRGMGISLAQNGTAQNITGAKGERSLVH